jgi:hypothetical protein
MFSRYFKLSLASRGASLGHFTLNTTAQIGMDNHPMVLLDV